MKRKVLISSLAILSMVCIFIYIKKKNAVYEENINIQYPAIVLDVVNETYISDTLLMKGKLKKEKDYTYFTGFISVMDYKEENYNMRDIKLIPIDLPSDYTLLWSPLYYYSKTTKYYDTITDSPKYHLNVSTDFNTFLLEDGSNTADKNKVIVAPASTYEDALQRYHTYFPYN